MKKPLSVFALTLVMLAVMDAGVAVFLGWAESGGRLAALTRYFDYGRSVPGKLARWEAEPNLPANLYDVAWGDAQIAESAAKFAAEDPAAGPVVRGYGMSFLEDILQAAERATPALRRDALGGPQAPPNFAYELFLMDRPNRRPGDVAVLGVLSSSLAGLAALSNQTWAFEQPAPLTYSIFQPEGERGLSRSEPVIASAAQHRAMATDPALRARWYAQLAAEDAFHSPVTYALPALDRSPFLRLVRRSLATGDAARRTSGVVSGRDFPVEEVLKRMVQEFARIARADGQLPIVVLIQSNRGGDRNLAEMLGPTLRAANIPTLATAALVHPGDRTAFVADGHFTHAANDRLGAALLDLLPPRAKE